jgi:hypothetical protein
MIQEAHLLNTYMTEIGPVGGAPISPVRVVPIPPTPIPCNVVPSTPQSTPMVPARYPSPQVAVPAPVVSMTPIHNQVVPLTPSQMQAQDDGHHRHKKDKDKDKDGKKKKKKGVPVNADATPSKLPVAEEVQSRPAQSTEGPPVSGANMYGGYGSASGLPPTGRQRNR